MCACNGFSCWPSIGQAPLKPILSNPPNFGFLLPRTHLLSEFTKNSPLSTSDDSQCLQKLTIPCHHQTLQRPFSSMNPAGLFYKNYPALIIFILLALLLCSLAVNPVSACFHQTSSIPWHPVLLLQCVLNKIWFYHFNYWGSDFLKQLYSSLTRLKRVSGVDIKIAVLESKLTMEISYGVEMFWRTWAIGKVMMYLKSLKSSNRGLGWGNGR